MTTIEVPDIDPNDESTWITTTSTTTPGLFEFYTEEGWYKSKRGKGVLLLLLLSCALCSAVVAGIVSYQVKDPLGTKPPDFQNAQEADLWGFGADQIAAPAAGNARDGVADGALGGGGYGSYGEQSKGITF